MIEILPPKGPKTGSSVDMDSGDLNCVWSIMDLFSKSLGEAPRVEDMRFFRRRRRMQRVRRKMKAIAPTAPPTAIPAMVLGDKPPPSFAGWSGPPVDVATATVSVMEEGPPVESTVLTTSVVKVLSVAEVGGEVVEVTLDNTAVESSDEEVKPSVVSEIVMVDAGFEVEVENEVTSRDD